MRAATLTLNSGKTLNVLIWKWTPEEGVFTALNEANGNLINLKLDNIKSGTWYPDRVRNENASRDLLKKAEEDGWSK